MVVVRGVNIFPTSIEAVIREFETLGEFRLLVSKRNEMDEIEVQVECGDDALAQHFATTLQHRLGLRVPVTRLDPGTLPRSEGKARRLVDQR